MLKLEYVVTVPSELSAGLRGFTSEMAIEFVDDEPDRFDLLPEAIEHFRQAIADWYDVSLLQVATKEEYQAQIRSLNASMPEE